MKRYVPKWVRDLNTVRLDRPALRNLPTLFSPLVHRRRTFAVGAAFLLFAAVASFGFVPIDPDPRDVAIRQIAEDIPVVFPKSEGIPDTSDPSYVRAERVRRGDTLGTLLVRMQVNDPRAEKFVSATRAAHAFYELKPGHLILARTNSAGALLWLRYLSASSAADSGIESALTSRSLVLERSGTTFQVRDSLDPNEQRIEMRSGAVQNSLFGATDLAGVPESIAIQITEIFAGELDFYRDVRHGDQFRVVYEVFDQSGELAQTGRVLAVEYVSQGRVHQAVWYRAPGQSGGYYTFQGQSLKRAFLRAPLQFTRISSGFGGRLHPILNVWKWHTGVDYAAPIGTPVRATGDGVVVSRGWQNGYGNAIVVRHQGQYSTLYGHLSGFAAHLVSGQSVSQGQVIGYVGMTGWATGPHLHYEFRINGLARDPLRSTLPDAPPVDRGQMTAFLEQTRNANHQIELLRGVDLARATSREPGSGSQPPTL
jgi:murein DD-endopeptidase MepM/ murein hydrolase activator NlpD